MRVAFFPLGSQRWLGGTAYLTNLLFAISKLHNPKIHPVLLVDILNKDMITSKYSPYAELIPDTVLRWLIDRLFHVMMDRDVIQMYDKLLMKADISVVSHLTKAVKPSHHFRTIGWIPDFQHLHLPEMFSTKEISQRNDNFLNIARYHDLIIVSSHDSLRDFKSFAPTHAHKARVLQFVAQLNEPADDRSGQARFREKYGRYSKFFFLPNQFWKHKNHRIIFEAVKLLKDRGCEITVLCTGFLGDNRNNKHMSDLMEYIRNNNIEDNIILLGVVERDDLYYLMRNCISVLNPSLFEGWSTTVEESKSMGKNVILSDIPVHREQNPPNSIYFNPHDAEGLANILFEKYSQHSGGPDIELEQSAKAKLTERTLHFAESYQNIVLELMR